MLPTSSLLTFTSGASSYPLLVDEVTRQDVMEPFQRSEFDNKRLRDAPTASGAQPIIATSIGGVPIQLATVCTGDSPRPLAPNTLANLDNIYQKFSSFRYTIKASDVASRIDSLRNLVDSHLKLLMKFDLHIQTASSAEISYADLVSLQAETFSYLTATGVNAAGTCVGGTIVNLLFVEYSESVAYDSVAMGTSQLIKDCTIVFDVRSISPQGYTG